MMRAIAEALTYFAAPFALYTCLLIVRLINPFAVDRWTRAVLRPLVVAGLGAVLAGLLLVGFFAPRSEGGYVPAHIEDGRIVPGKMR